MRRLRPYVESLVPVVFLSEDRAPLTRPPNIPESLGLRWGARSELDFTLGPKPPPQPAVIVEGDEDMFISGDEVHRQYHKVEVADPEGQSAPIKPEAIKSVTFYIGSRDVYRPITSGNLTMVYLEQTVDEYYKITFPEGKEEGERGEEAKAEGVEPAGAQPIAPAYTPPSVSDYRVPVSGD